MDRSRSWPILVAALTAVFLLMLLLGGPASGADRALLFRAQSGTLVPAARLLTDLGAWWFVLAAGAVAALWLAWRRRWRDALILTVLLVSERFLVEGLKLVFDRVRPDPQGHLVAVHTMAFPSGHAANAAVLGLAVALLVPESARGRRIGLAAALGYAFVVGMTRLVLGVHWPSDVAGGWALGALWTLLLVGLLARPDDARSSRADPG